MTPDKSKNPLPLFASVTFLEHPQTFYEWRYVLKVVKVEHQKGQWKQSLKRCDRLLHAKFPPVPLHVACLHFYAALSQEAIARQMHEMSLAKIQAFQLAKSHFEQAASTLPIPEEHEKDNDACSADSGSEVDDTVSLEDSVSSVGGSRSCSAPSSPLFKEHEQQLANAALRPSPLQICKFNPISSSSFNEKRAFFESRLQASKSSPSVSPAPRSPALDKLLLTTSSPMPLPPSRQSPKLNPNPAVTHPQYYARERYNEQLRDFALMLTKHIHFVDDAITKARESQATGRRRLIKERKIGANEDDEKIIDLRARIEKLKKKGWVRDRFVPVRYQELCERVLGEL